MPKTIAHKFPDMMAEVRTFLERTSTPLARLAREAQIDRVWLHRWLKAGDPDIRISKAERLIRAMAALQPRRGDRRRSPASSPA